jgi:hypothetical protein
MVAIYTDTYPPSGALTLGGFFLLSGNRFASGPPRFMSGATDSPRATEGIGFRRIALGVEFVKEAARDFLVGAKFVDGERLIHCRNSIRGEPAQRRPLAN